MWSNKAATVWTVYHEFKVRQEWWIRSCSPYRHKTLRSRLYSEQRSKLITTPLISSNASYLFIREDMSRDLRRWTPCVRRCWRCRRRDSSAASCVPRRQPRKNLRHAIAPSPHHGCSTGYLLVLVLQLYLSLPATIRQITSYGHLFSA